MLSDWAAARGQTEASSTPVSVCSVQRPHPGEHRSAHGLNTGAEGPPLPPETPPGPGPHMGLAQAMVQGLRILCSREMSSLPD